MKLKNLLIVLCLVSFSSLKAQEIPHVGMAVQLLTDHQKTFSLWAKVYPGMTSLQFSLVYDAEKMLFQGANPVNLTGFGPGNYNLTVPGTILCAWIDPSLEGLDFTDSTALVRFEFLVLQPGGSSLCFADEPLNIEFSQVVNNEDIILPSIYLHDLCYSGLVLLNSTGIEIPKAESQNKIQVASLNQDGQLFFTSPRDQQLSFELIDLNGRNMATVSGQEFPAGKNNIHFYQSLIPSTYFLIVTDEEKKTYTLPVLIQ